MSATSIQPRVDLWHRQRYLAASQHVEDGTPRARQPQTSTRKAVRQRVSNGGGYSGRHTQLTCMLAQACGLVKTRVPRGRLTEIRVACDGVPTGQAIDGDVNLAVAAAARELLKYTAADEDSHANEMLT